MNKIFSKLFQRKTKIVAKPFNVAEVTADFEQKIESLGHVQTARKARAVSNSNVITSLTIENQAHHSEAERAEVIAKRLKAILS